MRKKRTRDNIKKVILNYLIDNGVSTSSNIIYECNLNSYTVKRYVDTLLLSGMIRLQKVKRITIHNCANGINGYTITRRGISYIVSFGDFDGYTE